MSQPHTFLDGRVMLHAGSMLDVLPTLAEASIDACVTDGPYFLPEMEKRFGSLASARPTGDRLFSEGAKANFHGKGAIVGDICNRVETWREVYRVLKPGAYLLAFNCTKAFHRMACAAEDAGFEVRDVMSWVYATGFPHGKPLAKLIDRKLFGAWCDHDELARGPVSHMAAYFEGHDITLKPATELILIARKPIEGTIGDNLIKYGTGALDVRGCRVHHATGSSYPANLLHDASRDVLGLFPADVNGKPISRFFFHPKADDLDRAGSEHPTVKPVTLVQYLVRLVAGPGQTVLDPFAGSGTTGIAAFREGRRAQLIEIDPEFQADIIRRHENALAGPDEARRKKIKATAAQTFEAGTLFAGMGA